MATLIGVVSKVIGEVFAVASDGSRRQLAEGDRVFAGEQLETGAIGAVAVALANGGELTLGRESSLTLDGSMLAQGTSGTTPPDGTETVNPEGTTAAAPTDQQLTDVEQLQAAIEAGQDPTQQGEATAAGPGAGGAGGPGGAGGGRSFVLLTETAGSVTPDIGFPTEGLVRGPEFPDPEPLNRDVVEAVDGEPDTGSTAISLDEDGDLPGSIEGSQYGDDQPNVPASVTGTLGYSFGPDGVGSFTWNAVDLSGLSSHGEPLIAVVSADGLTLTAYRGSTEGPVVFTATTTDPATGAYTFTLELPLDHPVAGAEDNLDLNLGYTITDGNGTTAGGNLAVSVNDDSPELVSFEGEGEGQGEVFFPQLNFTVQEDALTQTPRGDEQGPTVFALPSLPLNAPYEGNNEDSDPQGADADPAQTVNVSIDAGPGSLTSLVNFGADGIGAFGLVDTDAANAILGAQNLTSGGVALTYTVTVSGDITTLTASVPGESGYDVFTLQVGADGSFSFTLQGPLDHPQADGNDGETLGDGELLGIDFTRVLTATDYDGDPVQGLGQANGLFTIDIEDDVPTVGNVNAAVTLDDEGLSGGINGGASGDVPGDAITTSGNLSYSAGADGLKSISLSGPTTLGTEEVTSTWDASTNTLTISSARGALVSVELTNLATGAYTVTLLQPLMHGDTTTEDNITLNVGFTVTDGDNDQASGNLSVVINDDSPTIQTADLGGSSFVTFQGTSAGYSNSYGYYVKDADGNPVDGKIIWANVHNQSSGDTADLSSLDPSTTGFFIIPNGATNNAGLSNGADVTFSQVGGQWVASVGGTPLVGSDGANVLFSDATLNPSGSHLQDIGTPGNQNWEDLTATSDFDYDDVATNVTWGSTLQLQVDETNLDVNVSANFSGAFNVQPGADGLQSLTYELTVTDPNSGLVDTATGEDVVLSVNPDGVIEGRTTGSNDLVFTLSVAPDGTVTLDQIRAVVHGNTSNPDDVDFLGSGHINLAATVTDGDGDTATGTLDLGSVISFRDDGPSIAAGSLAGIALVVDESVLGTDASADFSGAFTSSFGNDGAGTITYSLNVSAPGADSGLVDVASGDAIVLYKEGSEIVGRVGGPAGAVSFTVSVDAATGVVTLDQRLALEHNPDTGPDQLSDTLAANLVQLSATITDKDGDSSTATLNIGGTLSFHDDAPVITPGDGELPVLQVDETVFGTDATGDFSGAFAGSFGEDGAGSITYTLNVSAAGADTGLVDTASGDAIVLYKEGNDIVGRVGGPAGAISFTVSVDAATGVVTLDQQLAIQHSPDSGPNQASDTLAADLIQLTGTIVDRDGDTSNAVLNIGGQLSFLDDAPSIEVGEGRLASLVVDETDLSTDASADFSGAFSQSFGADGAGTLTYELNVGGPDGIDSGLVDTASGDAILLYKEGDQIVGRVGGPAGATSFTVSVDAATGVVTLDQQLAIVHTPDSGPDQLSDTLSAALVQLTGTITDKDGDSDSATLNIGATLNFRDDAPSIEPGEGQLPTLQVDETVLGTDASADFSGAFTSSYGEDGPGSISYSLTVSGPDGVDSGLVDSASGNAILLYKEGDQIVGRVGGAAGATSFTVTVNAATGVVTLDQQLAIQHSPDSGPNQASDTLTASLIQLSGTITDKDGDSSTASLDIGDRISFLDDAPSISVGAGSVASLVVDETTLGSDAQGNYSGNFTGNYGADGAGSITYSLTSATDGTDSGLQDTASGNAVLLYKEGDDIVGRVGGPAGAISFVVSVDSASGQVTLDQRLAIVHSPDTGPDQATGLASGLIQVTATITDKDGDSSSANLDLGAAISFEDDAPTAGQTTATTVLDDEGLSGGINGGPGDTAGAATSTSGTLNVNAGADGLQSIALSGPTTLGSESVTSVWNAGTNTLTISSSRGDLLTVTLTNPATGAYTVNLLQPLLHPVTGSEDNILLNVGVTVTDKDGDTATGSLTVNIDDDSPTIQASALGGSSFVTFEGSSAGYSNTYGYYTKDADGHPVDGKIIWANVHSQAVGSTADISGLDPSTTGFFIIPNGAANAGLTNGASVSFSLVSGQWVASVGGTALVGTDGANVLFTDASLNPGGSHLQDTGSIGNQNWEDKTLTSDYDYNDVSTSVTWGSSLQLQVDESNFAGDASANFSGVFNVQAGADGLASQSYSLGVSNANSGLVDTATGQDIVLSVTPAGVIEGRTSGSNDLVFTLTVSSTGTVTLDQLRAIVHGDTSNPDDATFLGAGHITLGSTVVDGDGDSATATVDLGQVVSFRDDGPSVSANNVVLLDDDALPNGIASGVGDDVDSSNASGTLAHNYGADGAGSIQWLTTGAPAGFTYETAGTSLVVKQGTTTVLTVSLDSSTGAYNVVQNAPIDHALAQNENNQPFTFNYQVSDKDGDKASGTLQVNVDDDTPQARNDVATVQVSQTQNFNTVFVLDFSGSIDSSELNTMLTAVKAAAQALFNGTSGDVQAQIVAFSGDATAYAPIDNYADFAAKVDSLNSFIGGARPYSGSTDFSDAVTKVIASYTPLADYSNQVFFISDGNPNENTGPGGASLTTAVNTAWSNFVNNNGITVTTIGVGDGVDNTHLQQVDVDGGGSPILVDDFNELITELVNQVTGSFVSGNVLNGSDGVVGTADDDAWGADGPGHIQSIQINGVTYSWSGSGNITSSAGETITGSQLSNVTTAEGGKLSFNFSNGAWTYAAPTGGGDSAESFQYTIVDHDGDPSTASLTVNVQDTSPVVAQVEEDELVPGGISDGDGFTTVATGSLVDLGVAGSTPQFSLSTNTSGLAGATSHGVALVYSVVGTTLTATAGAGGPQVFTLQVNPNGDYTFTLKGPLDHPLANGNDGELLTLDFASILQATDGVNPIPLSGGFLVNIEDDVPVVLANTQFTGTLQVDETFLGTDVTANFAGAFTGGHGGDGAAAVGGTSYSLNVSAAGANSGLKDTASGSDILLYKAGDTIVGKVGSVSGATAFVISVDASGNVTLDQQRAIVHSNTSSYDEAASLASGVISLSSTLTDADGDKASAQIDLGKAISFKDDGPTVSTNATVLLDDDALANGNASGIGDDADSASTNGVLGHSFGADGAGSISWLTTGAPAGFSYQSSGANLLIKQGGTTVLTVTLNTSTGAYTVTQNAPIDHATANAENNQAFSLNYQVTDKDGDKANGTLSINVDDDTPLAKGDQATVQEAQGQNFNTVFVLDFSGSIDNSELNTMLNAVKAAAQALFNGTSGDVKAQIVAFSGDATAYAPISNYADFAAKVDSLNSSIGGARPYSGSTDFSDAISKVIASYTPIPGYSNQVFFISDGNPNENTGPGDVSLTTAVNTAWTNFVASNNINITTIGVGDGIDNTHLQQVDVDGSGSPILVANFGSLASTLVAQVTGGLVSGNVLLGNNGVVGGGDDDSYGADGPGHIQSIQINGTTYTWNGTNTITTSGGETSSGNSLSDIATSEGGKLSFNFSTGAWSYTAPTTVVGDKVETFTYSIIDHDGDPSTATLTVYVEDSAPVVARVEEDELPGGITDGDAFTTVATGNVGDLLVGSSTATFSLNTNTAGLGAATSHGVALVYSVVGNTLTAKAGASGATVFTLELQSNGNYTFTLKGPLDHPLANGDDSEVLTLNFASILKAVDGSNNPLTLAGGFLVQIEDDVPSVSLSNAQVATLQVDETNLAGSASANYASHFTTNYGADGAGSTTYSLKVSSEGANSGLKDSASGSDILLFQSGNNIVGKVGSASGAVAFTLTVNTASGQVTLDQDRAVLHLPDSGPNQAVSLGANDLVQLVATSKDWDGDSASTSLSLGNAISFRDDAPSAATITQNGQASVSLNTNLMIVLDNSGSMGNSSGVGSMSRLDVAKSALLELFEQYDALGDVKVSVVSFSTNAVAQEVWVSIAEAKAAVLALQPSDSTNYDAALITAINAYGQAGKIATGNVQNVAYFLSDGEPNEPGNDAGISNGAGTAAGWPGQPSGTTVSEEQAWVSFLNSNNIRAYALGMGNGVTVANLDPIAYNGVSHTNSNGQVVTDLSTLTTVLVGTAQASPLTGNLTTGGGFGADGGYVRSLTVDGKTFSYDKTTNTLTTSGSGPAGTNGSYAANVITLNLASGGSLTVNVNSGAYAYTPPSAVSTAIAATILFTLSDLDGDTASAALNLAINASQAPMVIRDDLVLTNLEAQSGFDQVVIPSWALLANDTGVNHNLLSIIATSNLVDGNSVNHSATAVTFTEESNNARDGGSFSYTASIDGSTALDTAVVTIDRAQSGESTLDGTFRNEILIGRDGANDTLNGGDGDDILLGLSGNDKLYGGEGNDLLAGGIGTNLLDGGNGVDTASYIDASSGVTATLTNGSGGITAGSATATGIIDTFSSIENLIGSVHNDSLTGNSSSNYLNGGAGNDTLVGGGGNDFLVGGKGDDLLTGGTGNDTFIWEKGGLGGTDHITDFTATGGNSDVLDLSQLLSGVAQIGSTLDDYLSFAFSGSTTTIGISTTAGAPAAQTVVLDTVNLSNTYASTDAATIINGMLSDHTLKTDTV